MWDTEAEFIRKPFDLRFTASAWIVICGYVDILVIICGYLCDKRRVCDNESQSEQDGIPFFQDHSPD